MQTDAKAAPGPDPELARECAEVANGFVLAAFDDETLTRAYLEQASHYFLKAFEFDPDCLEAYLGLAYLSALTDAPERARALLAQARMLAADRASLNESRIQALELEIERLLMLAAGEVVKLPDKPERPRREPISDLTNQAEEIDFSPNHLRFRTGKLPDLDAKG